MITQQVRAGTKVRQMPDAMRRFFCLMTSNELEGKWNQVKGSVRQKFGKLTDDDLQVIAGKKDRFIGKLQERYSLSHEQAQHELDTFLTGLPETETSRTRTSGGGQY